MYLDLLGGNKFLKKYNKQIKVEGGGGSPNKKKGVQQKSRKLTSVETLTWSWRAGS